jgi:UDP-N-acetyl-2-amino-2-deoxyglucuronate dehydrogenase
MVRAFDQSERQLFVVKQNRLNPTIARLKRAIAEKRFGRIDMVNTNVFWTRPQEYYDSARWRGTWELDGGAIMNQASHYVDLMDWLMGPIDSVHAFCSTLARNIFVEDTGVVSLQWRSGALGSLNVTMLTYPENLEGSITILGEKGTVRVGGMALNKIEHWKFDRPSADDPKPSESGYTTSDVYGHGHALYYRNVIDVLRGRATPETDGREGLRSLELLVAIYLAARDRKRISLPLDLR